jgi:hypothetical protein
MKVYLFITIWWGFCFILVASYGIAIIPPLVFKGVPDKMVAEGMVTEGMVRKEWSRAGMV